LIWEYLVDLCVRMNTKKKHLHTNEIKNHTKYWIFGQTALQKNHDKNKVNNDDVKKSLRHTCQLGSRAHACILPQTPSHDSLSLSCPSLKHTLTDSRKQANLHTRPHRGFVCKVGLDSCYDCVCCFSLVSLGVRKSNDGRCVWDCWGTNRGVAIISRDGRMQMLKVWWLQSSGAVCSSLGYRS
jgi:hypothetical protein